MPILVLDDDRCVLRSIEREAKAHVPILTAETIGDAKAHVHRYRRIAGFIVDVRLGDGSGLDFLAYVRSSHPHTPALVLTGFIEPDVVARAWQYRAGILPKPWPRGSIERFLGQIQRSGPADASLEKRIDQVVDDEAKACGLSKAERDILLLACLGQTTQEIAEARGTSELTGRRPGLC